MGKMNTRPYLDISHYTKLRENVNNKIRTPENLNHHVIRTKFLSFFLFKLSGVDYIPTKSIALAEDPVSK